MTQGLLGSGQTEHALRVFIGSVHAHKPLRSGAVDERGLVTPAVHVAVGHFARREQCACNTQCVKNLRVGLPDVHAGKEREPRSIGAVALNRIEHFVVGHAVFLAGDKVVHAVSRSRVDDAGARCCLHIVGKVDRRIAAVALVHVVERVLETHPLKEGTFGSGDDRTRQTVAFQGFFNKAFAEDEITIADIHQSVGEVGVHVERLIGRDGPRGRCPNDN